MKQEYSYGAIVYKIEDEKLYTLIEYMALGHVSLPKGHIEKGETPLQCSHREILEETGLDVEIDDSFSYKITYNPQPNITKDVVFYLANVKKESSLKPQLSEVLGLKWLPFDQAINELTHQSDKDVLTAAYKELEKRYQTMLI